MNQFNGSILEHMRNAAPLEIEQDLDFQYRTWRIQRLGWIGIALIVCSGLLGLLGHHPLAKRTEQTTDQRLLIEYDRFTRYESLTELKVKLTSVSDTTGIIRIWFDQAYLDSLNVGGVSPVPLRGESRDGRRAYVFQSEGPQFTATFTIYPKTLGSVHGTIRTDEDDVLPVTHFVWP